MAYLTNTDQAIPCWLVKGNIPGGVETPIRLGAKSWFAE